MSGVNVNKSAVSAKSPRRVVIVLIDGVNPIDATGPSTAFATANRVMPNAYEIIHASVEGDSVLADNGLCFSRLTCIEDIDGPLHTIMLTGGDETALRNAASSEPLRAWMRAQSAEAVRYGSVCTGAFLMAAFGLTKRRKVVTHWASCGRLGELFPDLKVDPNAMYILDGDVFSSAGVTGGIDLTLALIEQDLGHEVASKVAKSMVLFLRRPGGQAQFSETLVAQEGKSSRFSALAAWITDNPSTDLSVPALAERMNMSDRTFARRFNEEVGRTPAAFVKLVRLEAACRWLETTRWPVKRIARECGFGSVDALERILRKEKGLSATELRAGFRASLD
uniref:GlxA family transcriptional regulator n=1 Tax=uncultured Erythrobacter sp. TaxID=263913 RepID=UPI00260F3689|nr:helix-turn-helix domain-containing protein [uncultured Erythrobacter sp.]